MGVNYNSDKMEARDLRWAKGKKKSWFKVITQEEPCCMKSMGNCIFCHI